MRDMMADRNYVLRNKKMELFAGFRPVDKGLISFVPVFVTPTKGNAVQVNVVHEDDIAETIADLAKYGHTDIDQVQVS